MKKYLPFATVMIAAVAVFTTAQAPARPAPTPTPDERDVVKITTSLIQLDVTVTDRSGKVITDLRQDEIEIYENGKKQDISAFSFVSNIRETASLPRDTEAPSPVLPPTVLRPDQVRRTVALVVDDLTLSFESAHFTRRALRKFVDEQMQEGDLVAIIRTGAGVGALQQFTSDKRMLHAAIERVKWNPNGTGAIGAFAPLEAKLPTGEEEREPEPGERTAEGREREFNDFRSNYFVTGTLGAVGYVVRGMAELPGRKSILLLSQGFRLFNRDASGSVDSARIMESLRRLIDRANRSSVVIYTLDPRGLQYTGITAADNTSGRSIQEIQQAESDRGDELREMQDGLVYLARQTGGFAFINNNDLSAGIRRVLDDQSYYLVAYAPDDETFDPKTRRFNRVDIRVLRKGTRVRYRSGFFGVSDQSAAKPTAAPQGDLLYALTSPFAVNEIPVRLNAMFGAHNKQNSYIRSLLHISAKDLTVTDEPGGNKVARFDIVAVGFGENGIPVEQLSKTFTITMTKEKYDEVVKSGLVYDVNFPIKKPGAYQFRIALRDVASKRIGSASQFVEVPNLKKNRLTLGGVGLENISFQEWQRRNANPEQATIGSTTLADTALRQFRAGTVLNYGVTIHNVRAQAPAQPNLTSQIRLFKDGKEVFASVPKPVAGSAIGEAIGFAGSISLAENMALGEYVLQIEITDNNARGKHRMATQFVQFDVAR